MRMPNERSRLIIIIIIIIFSPIYVLVSLRTAAQQDTAGICKVHGS